MLVCFGACVTNLPETFNSHRISQESDTVSVLHIWRHGDFWIQARDLFPGRFGSYFNNVALFDRFAFGLGEEEATFMDPQQRKKRMKL